MRSHSSLTMEHIKKTHQLHTNLNYKWPSYSFQIVLLSLVLTTTKNGPFYYYEPLKSESCKIFPWG